MNTDQLNKFDELIREKLSHYEQESDMELMTQIHARKNRFVRFKTFQKAIILLLLLLVGVTGVYCLKLVMQQTDAAQYKAISTKRLVQTNNASTKSGQITATQNLTAEKNTSQTTNATNAQATSLIKQLALKNNVRQINSSISSNLTSINQHQPTNILADKSTKNIGTCLATFSYNKHNNGVVVFKPEFNVEKNIELIWHFGDGLTSNETNPAHVYSTANKYIVELVVVNKQTSCRAQQVKTIEVTKPVYTKSSTISGTVFANKQYTQKHLVDLLAYNFTNNIYQLTQRTLTNENGYYEFTQVAGGKYIIVTVGNQHYLPTFYGNTTQQDYASSITVFLDDHKHFKGYDIQLINTPEIVTSISNKVDTETTAMVAYDNNTKSVKIVRVTKSGKVVTSIPNGSYTLVNPETGIVNGGLEVVEGVGKFTSSEETSINAQNMVDRDAELNLVPNPANNAVSVKLSSSNNAQIDVHIFNSQGAIVRQFKQSASSYADNINIGDLPTGYYYVVATQNGKRTTKTLIKAADNSK